MKKVKHGYLTHKLLSPKECTKNKTYDNYHIFHPINIE